MVKHIVFWKLKERAGGLPAETNAGEIKRRAEALVGRIPGLISLEVGTDFGRSASSADIALYSEFEDRAALDRYQVHPEHVAVADFVRSVVESRIVVDYEV